MARSVKKKTTRVTKADKQAAAKAVDIPDRPCKVADIMSHFGVSRANVYEWQQQGLPYTKQHGSYGNRYNKDEVARWLAEHGIVPGTVGGTRTKSGKREAAELRRITAQAEKTEIELARLKGELIDRLDVREAWIGVARQLKLTLETMPSQVVPKLGCTAPARAQKILEREIASRLETLINEARVPGVTEETNDGQKTSKHEED